MATNSIEAAESAFFRNLNTLVEPLVKQGWLSPGFLPAGLIVLEIAGRKSGRVHSVPLVAARIGEVLLVSTLRGGHSQWLRNLAARPNLRYWVDGGANEGHASVVSKGLALPDSTAGPQYLGLLVALLRPWTAVGWTFAIICPAAGGATVP